MSSNNKIQSDEKQPKADFDGFWALIAEIILDQLERETVVQSEQAA